MNCLIILLLLCCCGNSNNNACCEHFHDCKEKCNERERCFEEVRYDRECDNVRVDNRKCDSKHECDFCDDHDRDRRENVWKDYSDFRHNDSCGCDCN